MEPNHDTQNNTAINWILYIFMAICTYIESCSAEKIYIWSFRSLTLVSLVLIIIINFPKAKQTIFPPKNEK